MVAGLHIDIIRENFLSVQVNSLLQNTLYVNLNGEIICMKYTHVHSYIHICI